MLTQSPQVVNPALSTPLSEISVTQASAAQAPDQAGADPVSPPTVAQALGSSLRRIDSRWMKASHRARGERVWYQGGEPYFDVVFELTDQAICWFQMTLRGKAISWSPTGIQTAETDELEYSGFDHYATSKRIHDQAVVDQAFVSLAKAILGSRPNEPLFRTMHAVLEEV